MCKHKETEMCFNGDSMNFNEQKVCCVKCGVCGPWGKDEKQARKRWKKFLKQCLKT